MTGTRPADLIRHLGDEGTTTDRDLLGRFAAARDGAAFAELVRRHGPVVLAACRRGVGHHHDADDAFQAVFLVLARRAGAIRRPELLGNWLYRVAVRVARNARRAATRRRAREVQAVDVPEPVAPAAAVPDDLGPVLDEELDGLPAWYRDAVVLCDLRGLSRADAAAALGVPLGTLASRLDGGRKRLAARLARRGVTLAVAAVLCGARASAVPDPLLTKTCGLVADWAAGGVVPTAVLRLARGGDSMRSAVLGGLVTLSLVAGVSLAAGLAGHPDPRPADPLRPPAVTQPDAAALPPPKDGSAKGHTARLSRTLDLGLRTVSDVAWSPDGAWLAVTGTAGTPPGAPDGVGPNTLLVVAARGQDHPPAETLPQHARLLGFTAGGRQLLTETREDGLISGAHHLQVWHISGPQWKGPLAREARVVPSAPFPVDPPDAEYAPGVALNEVRFLVREGGEVRVFAMDLTEGKPKRLGAVRGAFPLVQFTPNRRQMVAVSEAGEVGLYQTSGERVWVTPPAPKPLAMPFDRGLEAKLPSLVAVAKDGSRLVAVRGWAVPLVLDATTGEGLPPPEGVGVVEPTGPAAVSGDGRLAALAYLPIVARPAGWDITSGVHHSRGAPQLTVWETATGKVVRTWKGRAAGVAFDPSRPVMAVLEANGAVTRLGLWDFAGPP
jgi:RNA polymerase sigma factor (sigma-70 family)